MFIYTITNAGYFCCNRLFCLFAFVFVVTDSFCLFVFICFRWQFSLFFGCVCCERCLFVCFLFAFVCFCHDNFLFWLFVIVTDQLFASFVFVATENAFAFFFFLLWDLFHLFTRLSLEQIVVFGLDLSVKGAHARLHCPLIYQASHIAGLWVPVNSAWHSESWMMQSLTSLLIYSCKAASIAWVW